MHCTGAYERFTLTDVKVSNPRDALLQAEAVALPALLQRAASAAAAHADALEQSFAAAGEMRRVGFHRRPCVCNADGLVECTESESQNQLELQSQPLEDVFISRAFHDINFGFCFHLNSDYLILHLKERLTFNSSDCRGPVRAARAAGCAAAGQPAGGFPASGRHKSAGAARC